MLFGVIQDSDGEVWGRMMASKQRLKEYLIDDEVIVTTIPVEKALNEDERKTMRIVLQMDEVFGEGDVRAGQYLLEAMFRLGWNTRGRQSKSIGDMKLRS